MSGESARPYFVSFQNDPDTLALSVTSDRVQLLANRIYRAWSSVDCFFKMGNSSVVATTSSHPLTAKVDMLIVPQVGSDYLAGIVSSGSGTLFVSEITLAR